MSLSKKTSATVASDPPVSRELTFPSIFLGMILGLLFGIGNAYLGLKVGTTVSASIPAAVLSMAFLRFFSKKHTLFENNIVQTIASVGEGLAAGAIFTIPALFMLGETVPIWKMTLLACLGGILGILFMIPLRRFVIVQEHGKLPFPEGTACAAILESGHRGMQQAWLALTGIIVGCLYKVLGSLLHLWKESLSWTLPFNRGNQIQMDAVPALLGVGFIIGPRIAAILFAGGVMAWWVIIPLIQSFALGDGTIYPGTVPVSSMNQEDIWSNYVRYIGAGTVAMGGLMSLFKIGPIISRTIRLGWHELWHHHKMAPSIHRTDRDISLKWLLLGSVAILLTLWLLPTFEMNLLTILLLMILGFFFVAVTSITVGIVGSTSNPASGMTLTTLLTTCIIFVALGWTERIYLLAALTMSCVVNVAITLASTTSQDLKTGFLLKATPIKQQVGEIIGILLPAVGICWTIQLLNHAYGFGSTQLPAPQASMMAMISQGVIQGNIPLFLVGIGVVIGIILECVRIPILPFAIGLYLPLSINIPVMIGGVLSYLVARTSTAARDRGILAASGLVAGDACMGVLVALFTILGWNPPPTSPWLGNTASLILFLLLGGALALLALKPSFLSSKKA